jgi:hypothetical protein
VLRTLSFAIARAFASSAALAQPEPEEGTRTATTAAGATPPEKEAPAAPAPAAKAREESEISDADVTRPSDSAEEEMVDPVRRIDEERAAAAHDSPAKTAVAGFAEIVVQLTLPHFSEPTSAVADVRRLVLGVVHEFSQQIRATIMLELEHALVAPSRPGELSVEQAVLEYEVSRALGFRGGVILMPMGIVNPFNEPVTYYSVDRPRVETLIIPSTWREAAVGVFGEAGKWRYQAYAVSGLDPLGFSFENGLRDGTQSVALARTKGPAGIGHLEYSLVPGLLFGGSVYGGAAGPNIAPKLFLGSDLAQFFPIVPVIGVSGEARFWARGLEIRAVGAWFFIGGTADLRRVHDMAGTPIGVDIPAAIGGAYVEAAFDLLANADRTAQLLPFVRVEYYDTAASISGRARAPEDEARRAFDLVLGGVWKPVPNVAVKMDVTLHEPAGSTENQTLIRAGAALSF